MDTIPSGPVKAALLTQTPDQHGIEHDFACELATRLPHGHMTPSAFVLQAHTILYDMGRGAVPPALRDLPAPLAMLLSMGLPALADRCLPSDAAAEAKALLDSAAPMGCFGCQT